MTLTKPRRLLVVDDDARWVKELNASCYFECTYAANLADGMHLIDKRRKWDAAIFDKFLLEGDIPFAEGRLIPEAGFVLAVAFQEKFPGAPACICSGSPDIESVPDHLRTLLDSDVIRLVRKDRIASAEIMRFLAGETPHLVPRTTGVLDLLMLQPNFCGLGINLRAVIDRIVQATRGKR